MPKSLLSETTTVLGGENTPCFSILTALRLLRNFEERGNHYTLLGKINVEEWKDVVSATRAVTKLKITFEMASDIKKVSISTWLYVFEQLAGEPLLPSLRELHIEDLGSFTEYLPLFLSPSIEVFHIEVPTTPIEPSYTTTQKSPSIKKPTSCGTTRQPEPQEYAGLGDLFAHLSNTVPKLQALCIKGISCGSVSWLKSIACLQGLQSLELRQVTDVKDFNSLHTLGLLTGLRSLALEFRVPSSVVAPGLDLFPMSDFLPNLTELNLTGHADIIRDFVRALGAQSLIKLNIALTAPPGSQVSQENFSVFALLGRRWVGCLQDLRINTSAENICDLQLITDQSALRQLHICGRATIASFNQSFANPPTPNFWHLMEVLKLPAHYIISLHQLRCIAEAAPSMRHATLSIDFYQIPSFYKTPSLRHQLTSLNISGRGSPSGQVKIIRDDLSHLLDFARHVDLLFPQLISLHPLTDAECWDRVRKVLKLCQNVRTDNNKRKVEPSTPAHLDTHV